MPTRCSMCRAPPRARCCRPCRPMISRRPAFHLRPAGKSASAIRPRSRCASRTSVSSVGSCTYRPRLLSPCTTPWSTPAGRTGLSTAATTRSTRCGSRRPTGTGLTTSARRIRRWRRDSDSRAIGASRADSSAARRLWSSARQDCRAGASCSFYWRIPSRCSTTTSRSIAIGSGSASSPRACTATPWARRLRSAMSRTAKAAATAYIHAGRYEIEIGSARVAARASLAPLYDPKSLRVRT